MTPMRIMDITLRNSIAGRDPEVPVKGDIGKETAAPGKKEEEEGVDLEEGMTLMTMTAGGILARRDEKSAQRP